ncbi:MAG: SH3 domain-containing protein [Lachnospiraceae bacterium]|nr:SH3 domain-containing protein [Lachnospiraceae bacterium]
MRFISKNKSRITVCALAVFVLALPDWQFVGISFRTWLIYLYTLCIGLIWICYGTKTEKTGKLSLGKKKWSLRKWNLLDSLLAVFMIGNVFQLVRDSLKSIVIDEKNLLMVVLVMLFFLLSGEKDTTRQTTQIPVIYKYTDVFLGCGFVVYMGLLLHFLLNRKFAAPLALLLKNEQALLTFLLLMVMLAAEGYYSEKDRGKCYFYVLLALAGYFLLFLQKNIVGILLGGIGFLVSALVHKPEREQIKRISQLAFSYFFLLANMSLLQQFIPALKENGGYSMEGGVYLELLLASVCVVFFSWWEKQPEEEKYLLQYKNWMFKIAVGVSFVLLSLFVSGGRLAGMKGKGIAALYDISVKLQAYCAANDSTFTAILGKYGLLGLIWLLAVLFVVSKRVWERSKRGKLPPIFMTLCIMYLLQSVFLAGQAVTAPVYVVFLVEILYGECALYGVHSGQEKKSKTKVKWLGKSEEEKDLGKKIKIWGILFLITFISCFFITEMEALAAEVPEGETVQEEPVTGVPIDSTTLMYAVEKVNVRRGPGTDAEILGELAQGEMVFAVELLEEGWYRIVFDGETGYVRQDFLAIYGTAGEWAAPEQPAEPDVVGQDSAATGKKTIKGDDATDDDTENAKKPASIKDTKAKKGNVSTIIIIAVAVLLILGYSVVQIVKEKRENEKGNDEDGEDGQQPEVWDEEAENGEWDEEEALDEEDFAAENFAEWEDGEDFAAEDSAEWEDGEDSAAAGYEKAAGKAENPAEDEMVIWDIDEE